MTNKKEPYTIDMDPGTMLFIVVLIIAIPLILTGFLG